ncbi:urease accessory protein UreE [Pseudomonas sp. UL073]|uniref:Urease accessory protein UreE n=1 Tax=Zestomonas insulae TaxID=2809017 RepID=A0ABS2IDT8_9GAMM|nr:urease accessory protein UreE [Pseudomonas insulae]MBM7061266.1 urease accessory protein UreE [Pseudomonas insulae]
MLVIQQRIAPRDSWDAELHLTFEARSKSRLRCYTASGEDVGLFLERGHPPLADGDCLLAGDGRVVRVVALAEPLLHVTCANPFELMRAAYHLGNRHVALQLGDGWLRLPDDYVLKAMLEQLGAHVELIEAPYQPEHGAYGGGHHHSHAGDAEFSYAPRLHQFGGRK